MKFHVMNSPKNNYETHSELLRKIEIGEITVDDSLMSQLSELLVSTDHYTHQRIALILQKIKSPSLFLLSEKHLKLTLITYTIVVLILRL